MSANYVLVSNDTTDKTIKAGPIAWDGATPFTPPTGEQLMLESTALGAGYAYVIPPALANDAALRQKAQTALANNITYLGIASPTQVQAVAQVAALTRQSNGVIRLLLGLLNSTTGT